MINTREESDVMLDIAKLARKAQRGAPFDLTTVLGPLYYRYLSAQADRNHANACVTKSRTDPGTPNHVLIVVIDALRPDTVPNLPMLNFTRAVAPSTWTFPSVTSMQTGLLPHEHGAVARSDPEHKSFAMPQQFDHCPTLPSVLERQGYETYLGSAFITPFLALRGWFQTHRVYGDADAKTVLSDYRSWRQDQERTYGYLQLSDLHAPIEPPERYIQQRNVDTSLNGLSELNRFTEDYSNAPPDWRVNRLRLYQAALDYIEDVLEPHLKDIYENTFLIVIGDHGEAMWEHPERDRQFTDSRPNYGVGHGGTPFDEVARVPAAVYHPNHSSGFTEGLLSGKDIPRTISAGLGIETGFSGVNWLNEIPDDRYVVCEGTRYGTERKAIYHLDRKIIRSEADDITLDARIHEEGGETFGSLPSEEISMLNSYLPDYWDDPNVEGETSTIIQDRLEALGYR